MEISGDVTDVGQTNDDEQGKIELLSQMDAGWLSFAIWDLNDRNSLLTAAKDGIQLLNSQVGLNNFQRLQLVHKLPDKLGIDKIRPILKTD